jgi:hypothetical protein
MPECPQCGGPVRLVAFDGGREAETGYRDAGERFVCRRCGACGDAEGLDRVAVSGRKGAGRVRGGGGRKREVA